MRVIESIARGYTCIRKYLFKKYPDKNFKKNILINLAIIEILIYVDANTCDICNTDRC